MYGQGGRSARAAKSSLPAPQTVKSEDRGQQQQDRSRQRYRRGGVIIGTIVVVTGPVVVVRPVTAARTIVVVAGTVTATGTAARPATATAAGKKTAGRIAAAAPRPVREQRGQRQGPVRPA